MAIMVDGETLGLDDIWKVAYQKEEVQLSSQAIERMNASRSYIEHRIHKGDVMYGVNTGFGAFSQVKISEKDIERLQVNLIRSHSCGVGEPFSREETRAAMLLRANALDEIQAIARRRYRSKFPEKMVQEELKK
ncbi:MAG: hypothetical protein D6797_04685, partial [Bdellovibrio sp.]